MSRLLGVFTATEKQRFSNKPINNTAQITHTPMKTKLWDIEADLAQSGIIEADLVQNEGSWIKFNINRGGGGHVGKSKHENERGRVKSSLFLSSLGLFVT